MAGILDAITGYLASLANPAAQQQPAQPVPQQPQGSPPPPAAAPSQGGLGGFLGNPMTQAALAGYFGAIGSPRLQGLGGRISHGGIDALSAYNAATAQQQQGPLNAAKIAGIQAQNALTGAQTGLTTQKTQQIAGIAPANAALAAQIHAAEQYMTPEQARRAHILETAIATDTSKVYDPKEAFAQIYEEPLKEQQTQAQTDKTKAETGAIPSEVALRKAETTRAEADATKAGETGGGEAEWYDPITKRYYKGAQEKPTDVPASKGPSLEPKTPKEPDELLELNRLRTMYQAEHGIASKTGLGMSFEQYAVSKGRDPFTAKPLPPPPDGGGYVWDADKGQILATDPTGKPTHVWQPES